MHVFLSDNKVNETWADNPTLRNGSWNFFFLSCFVLLYFVPMVFLSFSFSHAHAMDSINSTCKKAVKWWIYAKKKRKDTKQLLFLQDAPSGSFYTEIKMILTLLVQHFVIQMNPSILSTSFQATKNICTESESVGKSSKKTTRSFAVANIILEKNSIWFWLLPFSEMEGEIKQEWMRCAKNSIRIRAKWIRGFDVFFVSENQCSDVFYTNAKWMFTLQIVNSSKIT